VEASYCWPWRTFSKTGFAALTGDSIGTISLLATVAEDR
jgi:hypothetical protein